MGSDDGLQQAAIVCNLDIHHPPSTSLYLFFLRSVDTFFSFLSLFPLSAVDALLLPLITFSSSVDHPSMTLLQDSATEPVYGLRRPTKAKTAGIMETQNGVGSSPEVCSLEWDMQSTCIPMLPAVRYISRKLAQRKLYVALIVSDQGRTVMPAWHLPRATQVILTKIIRKACSKFRHGQNWMTAMAANSSKQNAHEVFDVDDVDPYLIRRSMIQHEVIFSGEGLILLTIDHVYTFKRFVGMLSTITNAPLSRPKCLFSCMELLRRINVIYTGRKPLKGYFLRVYDDIPVDPETLKEVFTTYMMKYGDISMLGVIPEKPNQAGEDMKNLVKPDIESPTFDLLHDSFPEAFDPGPFNDLPKFVAEMPRFVAEIDSSTISSKDSDGISLEDNQSAVTYPKISSPSSVPDSSSRISKNPFPLRRSNALCYRCRTNLASPSSPDPTRNITTIISPEWERFREIGLGLYVE